MAVEATNLSFFPPQLIQNRDALNPSDQVKPVSAYDANQMRFSGVPLPENHYFYGPAVCDSFQAKTSLNTDSGLTYNFPPPRKRSRDYINQLYTATNFIAPQKNDNSTSFLDFLPQFQQHQLEIDNIIYQHTKRVRFDLEERQKQHARLLVASIGEGVTKKLNEKDDQIQRVCKLNLLLQERAKSLYVENQFLRDLAQANEATANSLRSDLKQVLAAQVGGTGGPVPEDLESCCDSSEARDGEENFSSGRSCKNCGERDSTVLVLPCRHLCLCNVCASGCNRIQSCPMCNSSVNASFHVNLDS